MFLAAQTFAGPYFHIQITVHLCFKYRRVLCILLCFLYPLTPEYVGIESACVGCARHKAIIVRVVNLFLYNVYFSVYMFCKLSFF